MNKEDEEINLKLDSNTKTIIEDKINALIELTEEVKQIFQLEGEKNE